MTKSFEKIAMETLHGVDYSTHGSSKKTDEKLCEDPVLDLSCKKTLPSSLPPSPPSDYIKEQIDSPLSGSPFLENHQENNNNDNKHMNSYQHHQISIKQDMEKTQQNVTHHYHHEEMTFSSSNHERKSPVNRSYVMTPPSESDSPKKTRFHPIIYDHSNSLSDMRSHQTYPVMPINSIPVSVPISVPAVNPTLLPQNSPILVPQAQTPSSMVSDDNKKAPRPFKAYTKDPLSITMGPNIMFDQEVKKAYSDFRNKMLDSVRRTNEGTNIKMRRMSKSPMLPTSTVDEKDAAYWERRRKNNEAAKRSRDARRAKEDEIAIRAAFLEQEYIRLKYENSVLKDENTKIKCLLYGR